MIPKGFSVVNKKISEDRKIRIKTRRNASIKDIRKGSQERLSAKNIPMTHRKNTKSLKFDKDNLKKMLMERMQKRYDSNKDIISKRTLEKVDLYAQTQRKFRTSSHKMFNNKSIKKFTQKRFHKRSRQRS